MNYAIQEGYIDHGIAAKSEEGRSAALSKARDGHTYFAVISRGFIVTTDLHTGKTRQAFFPEGYVDFPFASLCSSKGLVYTGAGRMFMEFDPVSNTFIHYSYTETGESIIGWGFSEGKNGVIYYGTYPSCHLVSFDPVTKITTDYGRMDDTQMYMGSTAVDEKGWVYMGIGTEKRNIVAFNTDTGEKRELVPEENRQKGSGHVYKGRNGKVYGVEDGELHNGGEIKDSGWKLLEDGRVHDAAFNDLPQSYFHGSGFHTIHNPSGMEMPIRHYNLVEHELTYIHPISGDEIKTYVEYESEGASLSPLVAGPDGRVYGTTNHPFQVFSYDPKTEELRNWGGMVYGRPFGNICAYAVQSSVIGGASYAGGFITMYDTAKPLSDQCRKAYPGLAAIHDEIHRPRSAAAHTDGKHMIFGGFGGYGVAGGGLCIYNVETGEEILIENHDLLPYHSTLCVRSLANGDLICGTSIETPGGAHPRVTEAKIYRLDWKTRKIVYSLVPIPEAREISLMEIDKKQLLHCITSKALYFVFDPESKKVLHQADLSKYGHVVRDGMKMGEDGKIYGLLSKAIYTIDTETFAVNIISEPTVQITSGMALLGGRLYFGADRHLWSFEVHR